MLLTHSKYYGTPIPTSLDSLIASLFEISHRWAGPQDMHDSQKDNLASGFAKRLVQARDNFPTLSKASLDIRQTAYSESTDDKGSSKPVETMPTPTVLERSSVLPSNLSTEQELPLPVPDNHSDTSVGLAFPPLPLSFQQTLQSFTGVDPFCLSLAGRDHLNSQPSHVPVWNNEPSPLYTNPPVTFSYTPPGHAQETLSPRQRVSRYGGVEVDEAVTGQNSAHLEQTS